MNWLEKIAQRFSEGIPPILSGLAAEARKCSSPEDFESAFVGQIKHGIYWHVTEDPNFWIDPEKGPHDMSSMSVGNRMDVGKLMVTSHLSHWASHYASSRLYAALIDMGNVPSKEYHQVSRGMGNEFFVHDTMGATVTAVFPIKEALRIDYEHHVSIPQTPDQLKEFWEMAQRVDVPSLSKEQLEAHVEHLSPEEWDKQWAEDWEEDYREASSENWMQKVSFPAMNAPVPIISPQEAHDTCIGPFYHGTTSDAASSILEEGFSYEEEESRTESTSHGYENTGYGGGSCPAPVHHLGYGVYLTEVKVIGKDFARGGKPLEFYVLKNARIEEINWGATRTMMKWWNANGYECELAKKDRVAATSQLTQTLSSRCDAVLYKGKGLNRLLDGNQICIYNMSILRQVDKKMAQTGEVGSKVVRNEDGMKGVLLSRRPIGEEYAHFHNNEPEFLTVKWQRGGTKDVYPSQVTLL